MRLKKRHILLILSLLFLQSKLYCQAIFDTVDIKEFEIIGFQFQETATSKTQTIDSMQMREFGQQDLGELLSAITPVFVKSYGRGTLSTVSFRGTGATHTQVLWEGFQLNSPMLGQVDFSQVPNAFFSDVTLYYGGSSLEKSAGALGGSVNLSNSSNLHEEEKSINFEQTLGSFNTWLTSVGLKLKAGKLSSSTKVIRRSSDNDFIYYNNALLPIENMKQQEASFTQCGFMQEFNLQIDDNSQLYLMSWNQWSDRDLPPIMTNVFKLQEEYQKDFTSRTILGWKKTTQYIAYEIKAAWFHENFHYYLNSVSQDTAHNNVLVNDPELHIDSKDHLNGGFVKADALYYLGNGFMMTTTLDLDYQSVNSNSYEGIKSRQTSRVMVAIEKTFFHRLTVKVLGREEYSDDSFLPFLPYLGFNYHPFADQSLYFRFNLSKNYKRPTLNELYFIPMGNENLLSEEASEMEGGIDYKHTSWTNQSLSVGITTYYSAIHNWIQWLPSGFVPWVPSNVPEVISQGIEGSVKWQWKVKNWKLGVSAQYAYTQTSERKAGTEAIQLPYIPIHQGGGMISAEYRRYFVNWIVNYTGERYTTLDKVKDDLNTLPAFCLNHVTVGRTFQLFKADMEARIKVYNVFNIDYQAVLWRAMPGRYVEVSVKINL